MANVKYVRITHTECKAYSEMVTFFIPFLVTPDVISLVRFQLLKSEILF